jgi:Family of unknown function (DUF6064)
MGIAMSLPFSKGGFLDVFGAYNSALWPTVAAFWIITVAVIIAWLRDGRMPRVICALLAAHWAWSGIAYHYIFFRRINPAATLFGVLFVIQAVLFIWFAKASRGGFAITKSLRGVLGGSLIVCAILYPALGLGFGLRYPRMPLFAVPCPTELLTAGLLLVSSDIPRVAYIVPLFWAVVGSVAALSLGIRADMALLAAGVVLALDLFVPQILGGRIQQRQADQLAR